VKDQTQPQAGCRISFNLRSKSDYIQLKELAELMGTPLSALGNRIFEEWMATSYSTTKLRYEDSK